MLQYALMHIYEIFFSLSTSLLSMNLPHKLIENTRQGTRPERISIG